MIPCSTPGNGLLVCIYTCDNHRGLLHQFHQSIVGQFLGASDGTRILEVYANPDIDYSFHDQNVLMLRAQEKYGALSLKTHKMMDYCVRNFDFQHLLKIDVAVVRKHFSGREYEGRKPVDLGKLTQFLEGATFSSDYDGFALFQNVPRKSSEHWAMKKGGVIDYEKVFGNRAYLPPFYHGPCYIVSRRFARYIARFGREMAEEHEKYFLGSEDVMVGRLYGEFQSHETD